MSMSWCDNRKHSSFRLTKPTILSYCYWQLHCCGVSQHSLRCMFRYIFLVWTCLSMKTHTSACWENVLALNFQNTSKHTLFTGQEIEGNCVCNLTTERISVPDPEMSMCIIGCTLVDNQWWYQERSNHQTVISEDNPFHSSQYTSITKDQAIIAHQDVSSRTNPLWRQLHMQTHTDQCVFMTFVRLDWAALLCVWSASGIGFIWRPKLCLYLTPPVQDQTTLL